MANLMGGELRLAVRCLAVLAVVTVGAGWAHADQTEGPYNAVNNTGEAVFDLEVLFTGTGGSLHDVMITEGPDCATGQADHNMVTLNFPCSLGNGADVTFTVESDHSPIRVARAWWTNSDGGFVANACVTEEMPGNGGTCGPAPEPSSWLLVTSGLLGSAAILGRRLRSE